MEFGYGIPYVTGMVHWGGRGVYSHNSGSILPVADKADAKKGVWIIKPTSQELLCFWLNLLKFRSNIRYLTSMWDVFLIIYPKKATELLVELIKGLF